MLKQLVLLNIFCFLLVLASTNFEVFQEGLKAVSHMHNHVKKREAREKYTPKAYKPEEETAEYWKKQAQSTLNQHLNNWPIQGIARNVILFLGDGMSIPTLAASRRYLSQLLNKTGEEIQLSFEKFPYVGLSKTYCVDRQVADSACSATAYLCGVKTNEATIGVTAAVPLGNCEASMNKANRVDSIGKWSQLKGKRTGIVTTTRVTHASPAGVYANTAHRDWESDTDLKNAGFNTNDCPDIAHQLIHGETGRNLNVILGGGRAQFTPVTENDEEGGKGLRNDGRNLVNEWKILRKRSNYKYVSNRADLLNVSSKTEYLLGLFGKDHIKYNLERDRVKTPSLKEMTVTAIRLLSQSRNGYFLFVEGGRIDQAHHESQARKALDETIEFHKAIQAAVEMTNKKDTLIVVTADHAHTMTFNGYPNRGDDILGIAGKADDSLSYTSLSYANGPGYRKEHEGLRHDISTDNFADVNYRYPSMVPLKSETHGGDDVGIFAMGPWAHLLTGVLEQNVIPHVMGYASCVGDGVTACS